MKIGNVWQRVAPVLLIYLLCAVTRLVLCREEEDSITGEADTTGDSDESVFVGITASLARSIVCEKTRSAFNAEWLSSGDLFAEWIRVLRMNGFDHYFSSKPFTPHPDTMCLDMNTTCCNPPGEKEILKAARKEYKRAYHAVLEDRLASCQHVGRDFYHGMYDTFYEIHRQLVIEVNETLDDGLPLGVFANFFTSLSRFVFHPDMCPLRSQLTEQLHDLFEVVYDIQGGADLSSDQERLQCFRNVSASYVATYQDTILIPLERQLADLKLLINSLQAAEDIMKTVRRHTFSPHCVNTLTRLKYCAYCGGYVRFKPCLYFCMNSLRGCLADIAELHEDFNVFLGKLTMFARELAPQLQPEAFIGNSLHHITRFASDMKSLDLKSLIQLECGNPTVAPSREKRNIFQTGSPTPLTTTTVDVSYDLLTETVNMELECLEKLSELLPSLPEQMCYLSKNPIAHINNVHCWTGSSLGHYQDGLIGRSKEDQRTNPAFRRPPEIDQRYEVELDRLLELTSKLNETINLNLCLESDNEDDCVRTVTYSCDDGEEVDTPARPDLNETSGSGQEIDDAGFSDMESGDVEDPDGSQNGDINRPGSERFEAEFENTGGDDIYRFEDAGLSNDDVYQEVVIDPSSTVNDTTNATTTAVTNIPQETMTPTAQGPVVPTVVLHVSGAASLHRILPFLYITLFFLVHIL